MDMQYTRIERPLSEAYLREIALAEQEYDHWLAAYETTGVSIITPELYTTQKEQLLEQEDERKTS